MLTKNAKLHIKRRGNNRQPINIRKLKISIEYGLQDKTKQEKPKNST